MKGQPPKSPMLKKLQGNTGKRRKKSVVESEVPKISPEVSEKIFFSAVQQAPSWLPDGAKTIWREQLPIVMRETKLQESGYQVFASYCDALHRLQKFTMDIDKQGATYKTESGYFRKRPEVEMRDRAANDVRTLAAELNLTPKSWISSMGTFSGRQLDLFMNGGQKPAEPGAPGPLGQEGDELDRFLGSRPTIQ